MLHREMERCRSITILIDSYENQVPAGRIACASQGQTRFHGLMQLLPQMDAALDQVKLESTFDKRRSFGESAWRDACERAEDVTDRGKIATFMVRILFRQNASWQGSVTWLENHREERFRSALELILLMESALSGEQNDQ